MEDFKILLYVFGIVIYIIYMAMRKFFNPEEEHPNEQPRPAANPRPRPRDQQLPEAWPAEPPRQQAPERRAQPSAPASPPSPSFEEMMRRMGQPVEEVKEKAGQTARRLEQQGDEVREEARKKREKTLKGIEAYVVPQPRPVVNYEESGEWRRPAEEVAPSRQRRHERQPVHPYVALFQNPQGARQAFVLTQIFERKQW